MRIDKGLCLVYHVPSFLNISVFLETVSLLCNMILQVYAEGIHLVYMGASVINSTVVRNSDMLGVVPEDWQEKVNSILDNAYMYGRDGISKMVSTESFHCQYK